MSSRFLAFIDVLYEFRGRNWQAELSGKFYLGTRQRELFFVCYLFIWFGLCF